MDFFIGNRCMEVCYLQSAAVYVGCNVYINCIMSHGYLCYGITRESECHRENETIKDIVYH